MVFDTSDPKHVKLIDRLTIERMGWLTTVFPNGHPVSSPVWFLWHNDQILIYTEETAKVPNITNQAAVAFNLNCNDAGYDVLTIRGTAVIDPSFPAADEIPEYVSKYATGIEGLGMTPKSFADAYKIAIRITPTSFRSL